MTGSTELVAQDTPNDVALSTRLDGLKTEIETRAIDTEDDYKWLDGRRKLVDNFKIAVGFEKDPEIQSAEEHLNFLKARKARHIIPADEVIATAKTKMAAYNERKRLQREEEQRQINEAEKIRLDREAADRKREADEKAERERKEREEKAEVDRKQKAKDAEDFRKATEKQADDDRWAREKELTKAREDGIINKREQERLQKEADKQAADAKEKARKEAEEDKRKAEENAKRERERAVEDEAHQRKVAEENAEQLRASFRPVTVLAPARHGTNYRGGGVWRWEWTDQEHPELMIGKILKSSQKFILMPRDITDPENFPRIGEMVRQAKNKEKAEANLGGCIKVWFKDR